MPVALLSSQMPWPKHGILRKSNSSRPGLLLNKALNFQRPMLSNLGVRDIDGGLSVCGVSTFAIFCLISHTVPELVGAHALLAASMWSRGERSILLSDKPADASHYLARGRSAAQNKAAQSTRENTDSIKACENCENPTGPNKGYCL